MKTTNKIFMSALVAVIVSFAVSCTPASYQYPRGHGCLLGYEFTYYEYPQEIEKYAVIKLFTELNINSMERRVDFTDYAFMYELKKIPYDEPVPGKENEFIVHYRDTLCHAQTFRCSVSGDDKTIVLSYVDPDELPGELGDVEEYKNGLLSLLNDYDDFDLSSKLFINEGEIVLKAADYEDEGRDYTDFDFVLEWDGKEYILENR